MGHARQGAGDARLSPRPAETPGPGPSGQPPGACHNKASAYDFDLSDDAAHRADASEIGRAVAEAEDFAAVLDSLVLSKFVRRVLNDFYPEAAHVYYLATGHDIGSEGLRKAGERINLVRKAFNVREGWKLEDDTLPARVFEGGAVTESGLAEMLQGYYGARGWGGVGRVCPLENRCVGSA